MRKKYKEIRKNIADRDNKSQAIAQRLLDSDIWQKAEKIAVYLSFGSEVSTNEIVKRGFAQKKIIAAPITDQESFAMEFYQIDPQSNTLKAALGMQEPIAQQEKLLQAEQIDLCILPGIAFDAKGQRLGMGKGCYDRYLPRLKKEAVKVALAFEDQIVKDPLPNEAFDVMMDYIFTEKRIIVCHANH